MDATAFREPARLTEADDVGWLVRSGNAVGNAPLWDEDAGEGIIELKLDEVGV